MPRLEIPALYRLDIGSSGWGWHKMTDLTTAVNTLIERSPLIKPLTADEIGKKFAYLNKEKTFTWSDEQDIDVVPAETMQWSKQNLFVPAQWGLRVIEAVKLQIKKVSKASSTEKSTKHSIEEEDWKQIFEMPLTNGMRLFLEELQRRGNERTSARDEQLRHLYGLDDTQLSDLNKAFKRAGDRYQLRRLTGPRYEYHIVKRF